MLTAPGPFLSTPHWQTTEPPASHPWERDQISERTKAALAAAKARGVVLGATGPSNLRQHIEERQEIASAFRDRLRPVLDGFLAQSMSRRAMVERLNALGITAPRGGAWSLGQVQRIVAVPLHAN